MLRLTALLLGTILLAGCGGGFFKIPKEDYRETVKTLGVLPILLDEKSSITHPEREDVVALLQRSSKGQEGRLIEMLRGQKGYFDVRSISGDPSQLFASLIRPGEVRGNVEKRYRHYDFSDKAVASLVQKNAVDALLVVVLNGVERTEKRWDRMHLSYLEATFNDIVATAAVVLPSGEIVWEYPGEEALLALQYPDFDEAFYNKTDQVRIRYITPVGLERTLTEKKKGLLGEKPFSRSYESLFVSLNSALRPGLLLSNPFKSKEPQAEKETVN